MSVIKKISPRGDIKKNNSVKPEMVKESHSTPETGETKTALKTTKRSCQFCKNSTTPRYWDVSFIRRYLNDRGRIATRQRSGCCAKHQRRLAQEIKRARHLALLPFTVRV